MTTTFTLVAFHDFKRTLGKMNAVVECAELAIRKFIHEAETARDRGAFVEWASSEFEVKVDTLDIPLLKQLSAQFHIASVHQEFETFLRNAALELRGVPIPKPQDKSLLESTLVSLLGNYEKAKDSVGRFEIELAEYYRLVRNGFAHSAAEGKTRKDVDALRKLVEQHDGTMSKLNAPNAFSAIEFDDFILFTRVVKQLGHNLCRAVRPLDEEIVSMITRLNQTGHRNVNFKKLKGQSQAPDRLHRALVGLLRTLYSLEESESTPIVELLMNGPLA